MPIARAGSCEDVALGGSIDEIHGVFVGETVFSDRDSREQFDAGVVSGDEEIAIVLEGREQGQQFDEHPVGCLCKECALLVLRGQ